MAVERSVVVRLGARIMEFEAGMARAGASVKQLRSEIDKATKTERGRQALDDLAMAAGGAGLAMVGAFGAAVVHAAKFEKQMSEVSAVTGASAAELDRLSEAALKAGEDSQYSATEAAKAQAELGKAGLSTADILGGALTGSLDLAAAGSLDLAEAAEIAAKTMNMFNLGGADVSHIADLLAAAANKSATDVHEMGEALKQSGLAANGAGMSLEDTVGTLAAFADRALAGSDGGTSLKTALMMLQAPTEKSAKLMKELGIEAYDASGNFVGTARLAGELQDSLGGLTQEQRNAALATIFGSDAMRAANALYDLGETGIRQYVAAVDDQGAASRVAAEKTDNLAGDIERLTGSLETLAIESGSGATSGLRKLVQMADALVAQIGELPPALTGTATVLVGVAGAGMLLFAAGVKAKVAVANLTEQLGEVGPRAQKAATGLQKAAVWAGRAAAAFAALQIISAAASAMSSARPDVDAMARSLEDLGKSGERSGELTRVFGEDLDRLESNIKFLGQGLKNSEIAADIENMFGLGGFSFSHSSRLEEIRAMDEALAQMVTGGHAKQAAAALSELGISAEQSAEFLPGYTRAVQELDTATNPVAASQRAAAESADTLAGSWSEAVAQGRTLKDIYDQLNGSALTWARAEIAVEEAGRRMKEALDASNGSLDVTTEKGSAAMTSVLNFAEATAGAMEAKLAETSSVEEANAVYVKYRGQLISTLTQMTGNKKLAQELAAKYLAMPKDIRTKVSIPNFNVAVGQVKTYVDWLNSIPSSVRTRLITEQNSARGGNKEFNRWGGVHSGGVRFMADGGIIGAHIATAPMVVYGEPETGGEAYIPRNGDHGRNLRILSTAAAWEGQRLVPATATGQAIDYDRLGMSVARQLAPALADVAAAAREGGTMVVDKQVLARAVNNANRVSLAR